MTKTVFLLLFILQDYTGMDVIKTMTYRDLAKCENQRIWMKSRGILVEDSCKVLRYTVGYE